MGTWGVGLYSNDDALDLRAAIRAVCQLPYGGDELVELLAELNPEVRDPKNEGHATFWLVVADQFQRRGIPSVARERALEIIAAGTDLAMLAKLGMTDADLRKRQRLLAALANELRSPPPEKPRKTLKRPQPVLFGAGDVLVYRIDDRGNCRNPLTDPVFANFTPVGWDGCVIVASGLALEYLSWYQIAPTRAPWHDRPTLAQVVARLTPARRTAVGTMSKSHVARMGLELLGNTAPPQVPFPSKGLLVWTTAQNISAGNVLGRWLGEGELKIED